jgi:hypothetical protein
MKSGGASQRKGPVHSFYGRREAWRTRATGGRARQCGAEQGHATVLLRLNGIGWPGLVAWVGVCSTRWSMAQGLARRQGTGRSEGGQRARCSGMVVQRK